MAENRRVINKHENSKIHMQTMERLKKQYVIDGNIEIPQLVKNSCGSSPTELHLKTAYKLARNKNALSNHADDMLIHDEYGDKNIKVGEHCKTDYSARNAITSIR